ncbi:hypothetical protein COY32_03890 [candidate division WWE3 bacterium CG_4_10_14_0_2_um_filter_41_14]|uniref:Uncharacterized protein n=1 Tax=candidate division WWE3 bacterium CG_4_10_14_0_2_um_filter_41_14 TaxID=1975072 RepID=A0A2M7TIL0_UNCKA|nr:MAG: hypothetical protein COY32_03890 [candidate division WWE3 bacterium CG_4_10_14_0_2_um_filter_41_14]
MILISETDSTTYELLDTNGYTVTTTVLGDKLNILESVSLLTPSSPDPIPNGTYTFVVFYSDGINPEDLLFSSNQIITVDSTFVPVPVNNECLLIELSPTALMANSELTIHGTGCKTDPLVPSFGVSFYLFSGGILDASNRITSPSIDSITVASGQTEFTTKFRIPSDFAGNYLIQTFFNTSAPNTPNTNKSFTVVAATPAPGFWSRLGSSVTGVQCPANQTYIAIFDSCLDFASTMSWTMTWALIIASLLALVRFAIGSIQLVFSTGDPSKLQNGRESLTDAILGLVLLSIAWIVFGYLNSTLPPEWQINLLTLFG